MSLNCCFGVHGKTSKHLHPDDRIDEEQDTHEKADIGKCFEGLNKGVEEDSDTDTSPQKFDQPGGPEQLQESNLH